MDQLNRTTFAILYQVDEKLPDDEFERQVIEKQHKVLSDNMQLLYRQQEEMFYRLPVSNRVV